MIDLTTHKRIEAACQAVGYVTLIWAQIDINLDFCNVHLKNTIGMQPPWKELPQTRLGQKIKFARLHVSKAPLAADTMKAGLDIINQIDMLSEERHWLIHGATDLLNDPTEIRLVRTRLKGAEEIEDRTTSLRDVQLFSDVSLALSNQLGTFILRGLLGYSEDEINNLRRELSVRPA